MSSTLEIRSDVVWMPQRWIFDSVVRFIHASLPAHEHVARTILLEAQAEHTGGYCDLRLLPATSFQAITRAAEQGYNDASHQGPIELYGDGACQRFMGLFSLLKGLLHTDPRVQSLDIEGQLVLPSGAVWTAPGWLFDFVVEHLAATTHLQHAHLTTALLATRVGQGNGRCDLKQIGAVENPAISAMIEFMYERYGDGKGRDATALTFYAILAPKIQELHAQFQSMLATSA